MDMKMKSFTSTQSSSIEVGLHVQKGRPCSSPARWSAPFCPACAPRRPMTWAAGRW